MEQPQQPQQQPQHQHQPVTRVVSHWAKSTPEEGIQLIFNKTDTDNTPAGVRILTSPTSNERPCQWDICLRLVSAPFSSLASSSDGSGFDSKETMTSLPGSRDHSTAPTPPHQASAQLQQQTTFSTALCHLRSATPLLVLTLQRASIRLSSVGYGGGQVVFKREDVTDEEHKYHFQIWLSGASPRHTDAETDARTTQQKNLLFAMRQDTSTCNVQICIRDPPPPMTVPQACLDSASSGLLGKRAASLGSLGSPGRYSMGGHYSRDSNNNIGNNRNAPLATASSAPSGTTYVKHDIKHSHKLHENNSNNEYSTETIRATFWAHKAILESVPFFSRMLRNGWFKEGQPGPDGIFRINLSNDMFEPKIMDILLDYVYTREPIQDDESMGDDDHVANISNSGDGDGYYDNNNTNYNNDTAHHTEDYGPNSPTMDRRHYVSANVALNLQTVASEPSPTRPHYPQFQAYSHQPTREGCSSSWPFTSTTTTGHGHGLDIPSTLASPPPPTPYPIQSYTSRHTNSLRTRLMPEDWFLLYRAAIHMEDLPLQAQALDKIQAQLSVQSALERALTWGPGYPEIKRVVLKYVFDERRAIFGDEERNQLRPYLWPEIEDQVDVLVEITSKIARHTHLMQEQTQLCKYFELHCAAMVSWSTESMVIITIVIIIFVRLPECVFLFLSS
ncbi:hypothetical protein BKA57DRAFT_518599 [Linnemannia elongata]|nr:hypothetical protein BKA57DRAFT_518599 [Linnemannia elongata]